MGFTAGIYSIPKFKDLTCLEVEYAEQLVKYQDNSWAKEHFETTEKYLDYILDKHDLNVDKSKILNEEVLDFYKAKMLTDEWGYKHCYKEYASWCSSGSGAMYDFMRDLPDMSCDRQGYSLMKVLTKEDVLNFLQFCWRKYNEMTPEPCSLIHAYKYISSDDENEDTSIKLFSCDGIEVQFESDNCLQRIDTNQEWGCEFAAPRLGYESWTAQAYIEGIDACIDILKEVDFDNEFVYYCGGW